MELHKITTLADVEVVRSFFYDIFWEVTNYDLVHFKDAVTGKHNFQRLEYYLGYENGEPVGISGIYADNVDECWLGWFGIRPEYRRKGYATATLDQLMEVMKKYGYKVCRLYTDTVINKNAIDLYIKKGFKKDSSYKENVITMAKALNENNDAPKWQGKPLGYVP